MFFISAKLVIGVLGAVPLHLGVMFFFYSVEVAYDPGAVPLHLGVMFFRLAGTR